MICAPPPHSVRCLWAFNEQKVSLGILKTRLTIPSPAWRLEEFTHVLDPGVFIGLKSTFAQQMEEPD